MYKALDDALYVKTLIVKYTSLRHGSYVRIVKIPQNRQQNIVRV